MQKSYKPQASSRKQIQAKAESEYSFALHAARCTQKGSRQWAMGNMQKAKRQKTRGNQSRLVKAFRNPCR